MSLPPKFYYSHAFPGPDKIKAPVNTVDIYVDYACRYSAKLFVNWYENLYPKLTTDEYNNNIQFIFRNWVQVWHPTSNLLHESALAVAQIQPEWFLEMSYQLFKHIDDFFDTETFDLSRHQIYNKVYELCIAPNNSFISRDIFLEKLYIKKTDVPANTGNGVSKDMKVFARIGRQNGVHVTPTVMVNGYKENGLESSTPLPDVEKKLKSFF